MKAPDVCGAIACIVVFLAIAFQIGVIGSAIERISWENKIKAGKGPAIIKAILAEEEARKARQEIEKD